MRMIETTTKYNKNKQKKTKKLLLGFWKQKSAKGLEKN